MDDPRFPAGSSDTPDEMPEERSFFGFCRDTMAEEEKTCMKRLIADCISCGLCVRTAPKCRHLEHMLGLSPSTRLPNDHLEADENARFRATLCAYMDAHPCSFEGQIRDSLIRRFFARLSLLSRSTFPRMIAACCVLLILGNSVALAASATLPGDTLYPVKVNVLEPAVAVISITPGKKASWASTCIRRRLIEAERLIAQDRLTSDAWKSLNDSIASNTRVAQRHIMRLSKQNAVEAVDMSADLHMMIDAHGQVFSDVGEEHEQEVVLAAAADLSSAASDVAQLYEEAEQLASANVEVIEDTATRIMQTASSAAFQLTSVADAAEQSVPENARQRGDMAREFLKNAEDRFHAGEFKESLREARMAVQKAEEGNAFVRMGVKFGKYRSDDRDESVIVPVTVCGASVINVSVPAEDQNEQSSSSDNQSSFTSSSILSSATASSVISAASSYSSTEIIDLPPVAPDIPLLH